MRFLPPEMAQIPIIFNFLSLSTSKPARFEPQKHPKNMLIIKIPIFRFTLPSRAPPSVFREIKKKPKSVLNKLFYVKCTNFHNLPVDEHK